MRSCRALRRSDDSISRTERRREVATHEQQKQTQEERHNSLLMEVSNTMVRIYKDQFGRGPTRARSNRAGPDALGVCAGGDADGGRAQPREDGRASAPA